MIQRTETNLNDWLNDDDEENNVKNEEININNKKQNKEKENDDDIEIKNYDEEKEEKNKKEMYNQLFTYMENLQPKAKKKIKKQTYSLILNFVNENDLSQECLDLIIKGKREKNIIGLCELISKKTRMGDFKGSTNEFIKIIHDWFYLSKNADKISTEFAINEDYLNRMNLGEHYSRLSSSTKKEDKNLAIKIIKIIKSILEKRPTLELNEFIRIGFIDSIKEGLDKYKNEKKIEKEEKKKNNDFEYIENMVDEAINIITSEPKTWEEVEKMKKKILTTEFLSFGDNINDEQEDEIELIDNFIDPLNNNAHLNIKDYTDNELAKLHIQMESFDPVFFLEKLYQHISLDQFAASIISIDNNLKEINQKDEKLIDKNIYKYLDCKKLLDSILLQFKNVTNKTISVFNKDALNFQFVVSDKLSDLKNSFDLIIQSKMCKEILQKLSKYFIMKDKIQHFLKFSNLDDLADYLKKIKLEIKNINKDKIIYGEFYNFFVMIIEKFKSVLTGLIKDSPINETVLKYFKYLIEFDVESEIIDQLIYDQKSKMTEKINNYLIKPENTEIKNFRNFFCDEFHIQNLSDDIFSTIINESETYVLNTKINDNEDKEKELINVENIVKALLKDINEFLFTMKVLDENLDLKLNYSQRSCRFNNIVNEIYTFLFDSLDKFLFHDNFSMEKLVNENLINIYNLPGNKLINNLVDYYFINNDNKEEYNKNILFNNDFNKNSLQNLSNVIIDIFEKFEFHLDSERMNFLVNKNRFIGKIFFAFLNEKINNSINYFCNENTTNYTESQMSIFNHSYFDFTKNFIQIITKNYINVINFYMTIVNKVKNIKLPHELIYLSFFFILKSFAIHFYVFYDTETRYNLQEINVNLNGLIIEFIRNLNYLNYIIPLVLKNLFKNKEKDYSIYYLDYKEFLSEIKKIFIETYINNASENLNRKFINMNVDSNKENAYQDYNNDLILKSNSHDCFSDTRSVLTDIIADIVVCVRDFDLINKENKNDNQEINNENYSNEVIQHIIGLFYDSFLTFAKERNKIILCQEENQKDYDGFKYISQLYLEIQIFNSILSDFTSTEKLKKKFNMIQELLLTYLIIIKKVDNPNRKISENLIYTNDDLQRKNNLIKEYNDNYSSLFKYFINNH